jgi:uncharacterized protein (DUF1786 family)
MRGKILQIQGSTYKKILAIDIGQGTQDILLYDAKKNIENCTCLILPSPTSLYGKMVVESSGDLHIQGSTIGGGILSSAVKSHLKKGFRVYMEPEAAASIRDNLDVVRSMGIIVDKPPDDFHGKEIILKEVNLLILKEFLSHYKEEMDVEVIAVAVQDHGTSVEGKSDREFRFEVIEKRLKENNSLASFAYWADAVPKFLTRMRSVVRALKAQTSSKILLMDTASCALLGCMEIGSSPHFIVNVGNEHTVSAIIRNGEVEAFMEHHTHLLSPEKMRDLLLRFAEGEVSKKEIFEDGGHGALYIKKNPTTVNRVIVTGPNREKMRQTGLPVIFAAPGGNMMLTGPIGLVKASQLKG